jgi:ferredoxin
LRPSSPQQLNIDVGRLALSKRIGGHTIEWASKGEGDRGVARPCGVLKTGAGEGFMVYLIVAELCTSCGACELDCPNQAISMDRFTYVIDPTKCTECKGFHDSPHCASVCPVPGTCVPADASGPAAPPDA